MAAEESKKTEAVRRCPFLMAGAMSAGMEQAMAARIGGADECLRSGCQMWGGTHTTEGIWVEDCRLIARAWVREV